MARANADAERIRGEGEATAIHILNEAHAKDPEFAALLQTLESYKQILNERTTLILSGSNSLLNLLIRGVPATTKPTTTTTTPDADNPANMPEKTDRSAGVLP